MDGVSIIGVSLAVGFVVYVLSLRGADESLTSDALPPAPTPARAWSSRLRQRVLRTGEDLGFGPDPEPDHEAEPESFVYVPVLHSPGTPWQRRLSGVMGLLALVAIAAVAVALGIYQIGHVVNQMVEGFLGK